MRSSSLHVCSASTTSTAKKILTDGQERNRKRQEARAKALRHQERLTARMELGKFRGRGGSRRSRDMGEEQSRKRGLYMLPGGVSYLNMGMSVRRYIVLIRCHSLDIPLD
jgi:hypothetical protein